MADNYMTYNDAVDVLTPYAEKINTIKPEPITWAAYQLLTTAQKEAKRYVITDYPSPTGYVNELADLEDVDINTSILVDGQMLVYDSTTQKWENKTILENSLTSTATDKALTAAQGKALQDNKQPKELETPITIAGTQETTVETALGALNTAKQGTTLATPITVAGTSKTTVETALDGINAYVDDSVEVLTNVYGSKNLVTFPYEDGTSKAFRGVTYTVASDGSVSTANTATSDGWFICTSSPDLKPGTYKLSGCPSGGSASSYFLRVSITRYGGASDSAYDTGNGATFTLNDGDAVNTIYIGATNGTNMSGLVFYPMVRDARIVDDTFVPFAKTNKELTNDVTVLNHEKSVSVVGDGVKTFKQLLNTLFSLIDSQLLNANSYLSYNYLSCRLAEFRSIRYQFKCYLGSSGVSFVLRQDGLSEYAIYNFFTQTETDRSTDVADSGTSITLYY